MNGLCAHSFTHGCSPAISKFRTIQTTYLYAPRPASSVPSLFPTCITGTSDHIKACAFIILLLYFPVVSPIRTWFVLYFLVLILKFRKGHHTGYRPLGLFVPAHYVTRIHPCSYVCFIHFRRCKKIPLGEDIIIYLPILHSVGFGVVSKQCCNEHLIRIQPPSLLMAIVKTVLFLDTYFWEYDNDYNNNNNNVMVTADISLTDVLTGTKHFHQHDLIRQF